MKCRTPLPAQVADIRKTPTSYATFSPLADLTDGTPRKCGAMPVFQCGATARGGALEDLVHNGSRNRVCPFAEVSPLGRRHLLTQVAVLLPVLAVAGVAAWPFSAPSTRDQPAQTAEPTATMAVAAASPQSAEAPPATAASPAVNGLRISSQSWRRGGLGSNALVTFTLRNANDYAVKDIEIACAFARRDGSHLTDRKRIIPEVVNLKSRKTFAHMHIGFVNIYANRAKCVPVAASRV